MRPLERADQLARRRLAVDEQEGPAPTSSLDGVDGENDEVGLWSRRPHSVCRSGTSEMATRTFRVISLLETQHRADRRGEHGRAHLAVERQRHRERWLIFAAALAPDELDVPRASSRSVTPLGR